MQQFPKTIDEARAYRYGRWSERPRGTGYKEGFCAYELPQDPRKGRWLKLQCSRPLGHGPDALYCRQHAKIVGGGEK